MVTTERERTKSPKLLRLEEEYGFDLIEFAKDKINNHNWTIQRIAKELFISNATCWHWLANILGVNVRRIAVTSDEEIIIRPRGEGCDRCGK